MTDLITICQACGEQANDCQCCTDCGEPPNDDVWCPHGKQLCRGCLHLCIECRTGLRDDAAAEQGWGA